jgi:hypothetical protein
VWGCRAVFDRHGRFIGTPDILDPDAGVVGEYDGSEHLGKERRTRDVGREEAFRRVGLEYFEVTAGDIPHRNRVVDRMTWTRGRARWLPESERGWTIEQPDWWQSR